jgi:hypothetical protein
MGAYGRDPLIWADYTRDPFYNVEDYNAWSL